MDLQGLVLEKIYEPLYWKIDDYCGGVSQFFLAKLFYIVWLAAAISATIKDPSSFTIITVGLVTLISPMMFHGWNIAEKRTYGSEGAANPIKHSAAQQFFRTAVLGFPIGTFLGLIFYGQAPILNLIGDIAFVTFYYFPACDKPPPSAREMVPEPSKA